MRPVSKPVDFHDPKFDSEEELIEAYFGLLGEEPTREHAMEVISQFESEVERFQDIRNKEFMHANSGSISIEAAMDVHRGPVSIKRDLDSRASFRVEKQMHKTLSKKYEEHRDVEEWDVTYSSSYQEFVVTVNKYDELYDGDIEGAELAQMRRIARKVNSEIEQFHIPYGSGIDRFPDYLLPRAIYDAYETDNIGYNLAMAPSRSRNYFEVTIVPSARAIRLKDWVAHGGHSSISEGWL